MTSSNHYLLVCVNKEHYARNALVYACRAAREHGYAVMILHVIEPAEYKTLGSIAEKMERENRAEADALIADLIEDVCAPQEVMPTVEIREGNIEECIMGVIADYSKDIAMMIVGSSAETSLGKSKVVPPLAAAVGGKVRVPLLIVPGTKKGEAPAENAPE